MVCSSGKLQWFGHLERTKENVWPNNPRTFKVIGSLPRGRLRKTKMR